MGLRAVSSGFRLMEPHLLFEVESTRFSCAMCFREEFCELLRGTRTMSCPLRFHLMETC